MRPVPLPHPLRTSRRLAWLLLATAWLAAAAGVRHAMAPRHSPFGGVAEALLERADPLGSPLGVAAVHFVLAAALLLACRAVWRRAPKRPCDRLFRWRDTVDVVDQDWQRDGSPPRP